MHVSANGLSLIARFEGKRLTAYRDAVGVLTIGYGHTSAAGWPVVTEGTSITDARATAILASDVTKFELAVERVLTRTPTQNQFDAMVSLCYNIGPGNFGASQVLADFNAGDILGASLAFSHFTKAAGRTLSGLVARRGTEAALFKTPDTAATPQPAPPPPPPPAKPPFSFWAWLLSFFKSAPVGNRQSLIGDKTMNTSLFANQKTNALGLLSLGALGATGGFGGLQAIINIALPFLAFIVPLLAMALRAGMKNERIATIEAVAEQIAQLAAASGIVAVSTVGSTYDSAYQKASAPLPVKPAV